MTQNNQLVPIQMGGHLLGKMTLDGKRLEAVHGSVALSEKQGEFVDIQGKAMLTAKGFRKLNQIAGVTTIVPQRLSVPINGEERSVPNPYPIIDPKSATISKVWVRMFGIGYSPIGNLVVTSASLLYDVRMYYVQSLMKTIQYNSDAGKLTMRSVLTPDELLVGKFEAIEDDLGIYVNLNHKEVLKNSMDFINKKVFAERNAQTICERLVLGKHPALAFPFIDEHVGSGPKGARYASVPLWGWRHDLTREQLIDIADQAERGQEITLNGMEVQMQEVSATDAEILEMTAQEQERDEFAPGDHQDLEDGVDF